MKILPSENHSHDLDSDSPILKFDIRKIDDNKNLHRSLKKLFIIAQIFGHLPLAGISGPDYHALRFKWKSWRVFYSFLTIFGAFFVSFIQLHKIITRGMDLLEIDRFCFNFFGFLSAILFLSFARRWPKLVKEWSEVEVAMASYGWPKYFDRTLIILLTTFMTLSLTEHLLTQINKLLLSLGCNKTTGEALTYFLGNMSFSHIFSIFNYNIVLALILQIINLQLTFIWTYSDVFIMTMSIALASRFNQITTRIKAIVEGRIISYIVWRNLRQDYNRLCKLCKKVDENISFIVLLAFSADLFFILIILFNSLRQRRNVLERVYFYFSFGLLIIRTICLCLYGAKVHDESRRPLIILNSVSSKVYNLEIQRFIQQIGTTEVAITGRNFFSITRGLILSIAGAIVTYELVLIQFNDNLLKDRDETTESVEGCPIFV